MCHSPIKIKIVIFSLIIGELRIFLLYGSYFDEIFKLLDCEYVVTFIERISIMCKYPTFIISLKSDNHII